MGISVLGYSPILVSCRRPLKMFWSEETSATVSAANRSLLSDLESAESLLVRSSDYWRQGSSEWFPILDLLSSQSDRIKCHQLSVWCCWVCVLGLQFEESSSPPSDSVRCTYRV